MARTLGLDLGTNSIGWAIIDDDSPKIIDVGVRIFEAGVENLGEGEREISKNQARRLNRGIRKQHFRKKIRKKLLLKKLIELGWCPLSEQELSYWTSPAKGSMPVFPDNSDFRKWLSMNPYSLRANALNNKISKQELGRLLYHICQRRGFQSNSRSQLAEDSAIFKSDPKSRKVGIDETSQEIKNSSLGSYLKSILPEENSTYKKGLPRARNRYTTREMYIDEFEKIWEKQKTFHPELSEKLKEELGGRKKDAYKKDGVLFFQRPLKSQKYLIGKCTFEPKKPRCPVSAIPFEYFRLYQFVNSIELNGQKLNDELREKAVSVLLKVEKTKFGSFRKKLGLEDPYYKFNFLDDDVIAGSRTISVLSSKKIFGDRWNQLSEKEKEDIWHIVFSFDDKDKLKEYATNQWDFDEEKAENISKIYFRKDYSHLSRKAINNILPFLKMGFTYDIAAVFGGIRNAFGEQWEELDEEQKELIITNVPEIIRTGKRGGFMNDIIDLLRTEYNLSDIHLKKLYHHSRKSEDREKLDKLPVGPVADKEMQNLRNPVVTTGIFELRKVVNALLDNYGKFEKIRIELARDLKVSKEKRQQIRREQQRNEANNLRIINELKKHNITTDHENILKYKLWEECDNTCPYTGKKIGFTALFTGEVQIEHIFPYSRSLDDSYLNKTLCFADENRAKGNRTPYEFYAETGNWDQIQERVLKLFSSSPEFPNRYAKFKRFVAKRFDEDFAQKQLNDTRYFSREAKKYLSKICPQDKIQVATGQVTEKLRHYWGLNEILFDKNIKERTDHRHHAIDALVMASINQGHLQEISKWNRYNRNYQLKNFPMPWDDFRQQANEMVSAILVSHRQRNKIITHRFVKNKINGTYQKNFSEAARDQLHKEFIYGKRKGVHQPDSSYHIRKPLTELSTYKQVEKIVDPVIRDLVHQQIQSIGGYTGPKKDKIPSGAFVTYIENDEPEYLIKLPNKNGDPVPVRKVRIQENLGNAERLKEINQYVNPRNNHHVLIYEDQDGNLKEEIVTFWTVVERLKQKQPIYQLPTNGKEVITTLKINDMFLIGLSDEDYEIAESGHELGTFLYRVQKISSMYYTFRHHKASTLNNHKEEIRIVSFKAWIKLNPIKVNIDVIGKITKI